MFYHQITQKKISEDIYGVVWVLGVFIYAEICFLDLYWLKCSFSFDLEGFTTKMLREKNVPTFCPKLSYCVQRASLKTPKYFFDKIFNYFVSTLVKNAFSTVCRFFRQNAPILSIKVVSHCKTFLIGANLFLKKIILSEMTFRWSDTPWYIYANHEVVQK